MAWSLSLATVSSSDSALRPVMQTLSPRSTRAWAIARPMPRLAPVTMAARVSLMETPVGGTVGYGRVTCTPGAMYARGVPEWKVTSHDRRRAFLSGGAGMTAYGLTIPHGGVPLHAPREVVASQSDLGYTDG